MVANKEAKWQCLAFPKDFTPATEEIRRIPQLGVSKKAWVGGARAPAQQSLPRDRHGEMSATQPPF